MKLRSVVEPALEARPALLDIGRERAAHQAQPVAIRHDLVLGVYRGDGVLEVHDRRDRCLDDDVGHAGCVGLPDFAVAVDDDLDVQTVVDEKDRGRRVARPPVAGKLARVLQAAFAAIGEHDLEPAAFDRVGRDIGVACRVERGRLIEEGPHARDHLLAADGIVAVASLGAIGLWTGVRTVERVVEAAPAGVRGVERIARVRDGHDELGTGDRADLRVDILGRDLVGVRRRGDAQIVDLAQEPFVGGCVVWLALALAVPRVDLGLHLVTHGQEFAMLAREVADDGGEAFPERRGKDFSARQHFLLDEGAERAVNAQAGDGVVSVGGGHGGVPRTNRRRRGRAFVDAGLRGWTATLEPVPKVGRD